MDFSKQVYDPRMERSLEQLQDDRAITIDDNVRQDFPLNDEPLCDFVSHNVEMLRGKKECSILDYLFFSNRNMDIIQNAIRKGVYDISGHIIGKQSENELLMIMRSIFYINLPLEFPNITKNIEFLNKAVVDQALPKILSSMKQYLIYLKDVHQNQKPNERPENDSISGTKQLGFQPFI